MEKNIDKIKAKIPLYVKRVADVLSENGYEAYLVGGSVRDLILGKDPSDFDIATNCAPDGLKKIFPKTVDVGAKFGTVVVVMEDRDSERYNVEVTTYRSESDYVSSRWPSKVEFADKLEDDLERRDFTINALAIDLVNLDDSGASFDEVVVDMFGGINDLQEGLIRAVGNPKERFSEDGLRLVRACRLASQLNFTIETGTFEAIRELSYIIKNIAIERVRDEFLKVLYKSPKPSVGIELLRKGGLLEIFLPELVEGIGVTQPEFHVDDVYNHTLKVVDVSQDEIKLVALFHDIAKPKTYSKDEKGVHFYQHDIEGAKIAQEVMQRMKFPKKEIDRVALLVRHHMFYYPSADWRKQNDQSINQEHLEKLRREEQENYQSVGGWSDAAIRRFISRVGGMDNVEDLIKLRIADASANPKSTFTDFEIDALQERISKILAEDSAFKISDLAVDGHDLLGLGIKGADIGKILNELLEKVLEDPTLNEKERLLNIVKELL
ncbi:HD domain-containing protein [Candidatus Dojkabacteria bacterium]|nr:HD domain-containing protein [Candidatus Dojkabacteria bacterium]